MLEISLIESKRPTELQIGEFGYLPDHEIQFFVGLAEKQPVAILLHNEKKSFRIAFLHSLQGLALTVKQSNLSITLSSVVAYNNQRPDKRSLDLSYAGLTIFGLSPYGNDQVYPVEVVSEWRSISNYRYQISAWQIVTRLDARSVVLFDVLNPAPAPLA